MGFEPHNNEGPTEIRDILMRLGVQVKHKRTHMAWCDNQYLLVSAHWTPPIPLSMQILAEKRILVIMPISHWTPTMVPHFIHPTHPYTSLHIHIVLIGWLPLITIDEPYINHEYPVTISNH